MWGGGLFSTMVILIVYVFETFNAICISYKSVAILAQVHLALSFAAYRYGG